MQLADDAGAGFVCVQSLKVDLAREADDYTRDKTDLLTELPGRCRRGCVPYRARLARFATRDQRCGCAA